MKKILCWSDSPTAGTGFGVVSKHVIGALHKTGKYEIDQLAINFHGDFVDKNEVPWQLQPSRLLDPKDPHGIKMFARSLAKKDYDYVWVLNDLFITTEVEDLVNKVRDRCQAQGKKPPVFIYYYPVDCKVQADSTGFLRTADILVAYTEHGKQETIKALPSLASKIYQIPHGVDTKAYRPLDPATCVTLKQSVFKVTPDTTVVVNVNRNSSRKQIPYSILAFKEFRKYVPNSVYYIHTMAQDQGGDMIRAIADAGLVQGRDVILPAKYSPAVPAPVEVMNKIYNMADMFLTTHLGEGWGLTITEAMATGVPVVAPRNTCMAEQLGENSERGYLYPCTDTIWIDNSGYRPKGNIDGIVQKMLEAHHAGRKEESSVVKRALDWAKTHDWDEVTKAWLDLFDKADSLVKTKNQDSVAQVI